MKKALAILLTLAMIFSTMACLSVVSFAVVEHTHCICGTGADIGDHTSHSAITYTAWESTTTLPTTAGNYYLTGDVTLSKYVYYGTDIDVNICLNGHKIINSCNAETNGAISTNSRNCNVALTNCTGNAVLTQTEEAVGPIFKGVCYNTVTKSSDFKFFNITVQGIKSVYNSPFQFELASTQTFNSNVYFYNMKFLNNSGKTAGALYYRGKATDTTAIKIYDSIFEGNTGSLSSAIWAFAMDAIIENSTFKGNTSTGSGQSYGATVYIKNNKDQTNVVKLSDVTITNNTAAGSYGALTISGPNFYLKDVAITDNSTTSTFTPYCGGLFYDAYYGSLDLSGKITITGNTADGKEANYYGGGSSSGSVVPTLTNLDPASEFSFFTYDAKYSSFNNRVIFTADKTGYLANVKSSATGILFKELDDGSIYAYKPVAITGLSTSVSSTSLKDVKDSTTQVNVTYYPTNASYKELTWTSSNESVAKVDANGLVTVVGVGTVTIKATSVAKPTISSSVTLTISHDYSEYVSDNNATCTADGTKTKTCANCGATDTVADTGSTLGHKFTTYTSNNDATCTEDGTKTAKCDRCDATDTITDTDSALGHKFTTYTSDNNATCTADGTKTAKCDRCDATDTVADADSALGHKFTTYTSDSNATCTADGTKTAKCDRCDVTDTVADVDSVLGHTEAVRYENVVAPSCTEDGSQTVVTYCSVCEEVLASEDEAIAATGHNYESHGLTMVCANCGDSYNGCKYCAIIKTTDNSFQNALVKIIDVLYHAFFEYFAVFYK